MAGGLLADHGGPGEHREGVTTAQDHGAGGTSVPRARPKVVAVIMTYNCAHLLPKAYEKIPKDLVGDILVTDDGSTDHSYEVARSLGVTAFRHTPNRGYGGNLKEGLRLALARGADYIVEIHGDGQFDPEALRPAMPLIADGVHFIIGSRFRIPGRARALGMPWSRYLANRVLSFFDRLILRLPFTEFHTGFRIYSREFLARVAWEENADNYLFSFQIIAQAAYAGVRTAEVPVEADYHGAHTSHSIRGAAVYAVQTFWVLAQFLLAVWGLRSSHLFPSPQPTAAFPSPTRTRSRFTNSRALSPPLDLARMLVTGGEGMIGRALPFGRKLSRRDLDVRNAAQVADVVRAHAPSAILHLAALDIRQAEADPKNAYATNVLGTSHLARAAREHQIPFIFFSSGAVFGGGPGVVHDEEAEPDPVNIFGQTKWLAEMLLREMLDDHLIIRTGWVFGGHQAHHRKFVDLAIERARQGEPILAASDHWGSPTLVTDLVAELERLLQDGTRGLVHVVNAGVATGVDIARVIVETLGSRAEISPVRGTELPSPGPPRAVSEGLCSREQRLRPWPAALAAYVQSVLVHAPVR